MLLNKPHIVASVDVQHYWNKVLRTDKTKVNVSGKFTLHCIGRDCKPHHY